MVTKLVSSRKGNLLKGAHLDDASVLRGLTDAAKQLWTVVSHLTSVVDFFTI